MYTPQVDSGHEDRRLVGRKLLFAMGVLLLVAVGAAVFGPVSENRNKQLAVEARKDTDPRTSGYQASADFASVKSMIENGKCQYMFTSDARIDGTLYIRRASSCRVYQNHVELTSTYIDIVQSGMRVDFVTRTIYLAGTAPAPYHWNCKMHVEYKRLVTGADVYPPSNYPCTLVPNGFYQSNFKVGVILQQENWVTHVTKHTINGGATGGATGSALNALMNDKGICPSVGLIRSGTEEVVFESGNTCGYSSAKPAVQGTFVGANGDQTVVMLKFWNGDLSLSECRVAVLTSTGATVVGETSVFVNQQFPSGSSVLNGLTCAHSNFVLYW